jgi:hypothetical protein
MHRVSAAATRLSAAMQISSLTTLAAADELRAATSDATAWYARNPCPHRVLGRLVAGNLQTCAEVAVSAQPVATDEASLGSAALRRLRSLLEVLAAQSEIFETW